MVPKTSFLPFKIIFLNFLAYTGSQIGLVITQCMGLSGLIQWGMRQSAEMDNQMTAVERVLEFTTVEQEEDLHSVQKRLHFKSKL